jgi:trehalose synthase
LSRPAVDLREAPLAARSFDRLSDQLDSAARERLLAAREDARATLQDRRVWWVNSTSRGGGIAEMLRTLLPYWRGSGIDSRWLVLEAPSAYFRLTKHLHNLLHGIPGRPPTSRDRALFESVAAVVGAMARELVAPGDVVVLEDPQTAGLVPELAGRGATVIWRSHVGADRMSPAVESAWRFLLPFVEAADALLFTRREYVPAELEDSRTWVLPPAIDPLSAKNQPLPAAASEAIMQRCGLARARHRGGSTRVALQDGRIVDVRRRCGVLREDRPPRLDADRLVVALARWDRLKDPSGIVRGFASRVRHPRARLIVAGPASGAIADDPGSRAVLREVHGSWRELPRSRRSRIDVVTLPMVDVDENSLMVNALQRQASVVVKKSLQEAFGLGVTEGLWKARPVVASGVGGHRDQVEDHRTGLLVDDPTDLTAFGAAIDELLDDPEQASALGRAGRERVRSRFLADRHFIQWTAMLNEILLLAAV